MKASLQSEREREKQSGDRVPEVSGKLKGALQFIFLQPTQKKEKARLRLAHGAQDGG